MIWPIYLPLVLVFAPAGKSSFLSYIFSNPTVNITQIAPHSSQISPLSSLLFMKSLISIMYDLQAHQTMVMSLKHAMHSFAAMPSLLAFLQLRDPFLHYPPMYTIFSFLSKADKTLTKKPFLISAVTVIYTFRIKKNNYIHTYSELTYSSPLDENSLYFASLTNWKQFICKTHNRVP